MQEAWEIISNLVRSRKSDQLEQYLDTLSRAEKARAISRLEDDVHSHVLECLSNEAAADLMEDIFDNQAVELIEDLPIDKAAAIVDEMVSDEQADLLGHLEEDHKEEILQKMDPEEAVDARLLVQFPEDTAGGMMVTEYLSFSELLRAKDVIDNLRNNGDEYSDYDVQYIYVISKTGLLKGILPLRSILLSAKNTSLNELSIKNPLTVSTETTLDELKKIFGKYDFIGIPVTDDTGQLVGVVLRKAVLEAVDEMIGKSFLNFSGIVGGEELRSMPLFTRSFHRLSWLSVNIFLNIIAASVIAFYQDTLTTVIALAVFLPIISDMSGCSGNQAVAVSIRELSLGQVKPDELIRVLFKEAGIGIINGIILGLLIGGVAFCWKGNFYLGLVVGGALALNSLFAVCLGGSIPLVLKHFKMDPALASSPILTTITDMCGFFMVLSFAQSILPKLN